VDAECDLAVLNGNHATTLTMLLAGKPVLQSPLFVEQGLNARATVELGAGLSTFPRGLDVFREQLADLLDSPKYMSAAGQFAAKYAGFSREREISDSIRRLEDLLAGPG
jgi:UDP:flavonoid glycosyltransferase YjiC (YdhE family)